MAAPELEEPIGDHHPVLHRVPSVSAPAPRGRPARPSGPRVNGAIRARRVLLIDETGQKVGEVTLPDALARAQAAELDLVEVAPGVDPPVCRIVDYGKLRYEASLKEKAARKASHTDELKEIKLRPGIGDHDYDVKLRKLIELLGKGHRVKVTVTLRGRMQSRPEAADAVLERVTADVGEAGRCEAHRRMGRNAMMTVVPVKSR